MRGRSLVFILPFGLMLITCGVVRRSASEAGAGDERDARVDGLDAGSLDQCVAEGETLEGLPPVPGCKFGPSPTLIAAATVFDAPAEQLVVDGGELFMRHGYGPKLTAVSTCGGAVRLVTCELAGNDIAVDAKHVFWRRPLPYPRNSGELVRAPRGGGPVEVMPAGDGDGYRAEVEVDDENVYFSVCCDRDDGVAQGIYAWPKRGGERRLLAMNFTQRSLQRVGDGVYFIGAPSSASSSRAGLARVSTTHGEFEMLIAPNPMREIGPYAVHGAYIYYRLSTDAGGAYELHRVRTDASADEVLVADAGDVPRAFVVGGDGIFGFVDREGGSTDLVRIPLDGGAPTGLATIETAGGVRLGPLAQDDGALYWTVAEEECAYMHQLSIDLPPTCRYRYRLQVFRLEKAQLP